MLHFLKHVTLWHVDFLIRNVHVNGTIRFVHSYVALRCCSQTCKFIFWGENEVDLLNYSQIVKGGMQGIIECTYSYMKKLEIETEKDPDVNGVGINHLSLPEFIWKALWTSLNALTHFFGKLISRQNFSINPWKKWKFLNLFSDLKGVLSQQATLSPLSDDYYNCRDSRDTTLFDVWSDIDHQLFYMRAE